ncbi:hypothetical protein PP175_26020 (plasmid) [Aneurinibacillus sp. Ricciae_BoGa-3]|uniref:hypothetical protein n=1 Tax=Aneurinibacillus sp. Ricciae_BoGa-3 TaxID=3022697 RepID=UPI002341F30C|nr:hypothetical protein [Aneurinibacillus sp. Ricciae_BoGa-3]WCK57524.1 hypothetical protein PP175_26020 [Aneurinibacillus sp. Ricciae_BoGa-3]
MSYTIEYNKQIFFIPNGEEKLYFLFVRQGDNNVYEANNTVRAKSWYFVEVGTEKELWKRIGSWAGAVEGGGIQKAVGWQDTKWYTIEEYIKQYRSKFKNAKPLETMLDTFEAVANILMRNTFTNERDKEFEPTLRHFVEKYQMQESGCDYYDKEKIRYRVSIKDTEMLKDFLLNLPERWGKDYSVEFAIDKQSKRRRRLW